MTRDRGGSLAGDDWWALDGRWPDPPPAVSVIVLHHEQPAQLERTLHALGRQRFGGDLEIVVVDDGSETAPDVPDGVALVRQSRAGARRSAARNRGAQASRGDVLCFLDADTTPEPDYVAELTRLPALTADTVTVGRRRHARLDTVPAGADIATAGPANELMGPRWLAAGYLASQNLRHAGPGDFRFIISAVLGVSRRFFETVGGFDESFDAYGGEDWEWAHRAWLAGAGFAHVPGAVAWHDGPDWAERGAERGARVVARAQKNAEAMRLAQLITAPGHRPLGLLAHRPETAISFTAPLGPAASFICVDSLLAALPRAVVYVGAELLPHFGADPRVLAATPSPEPRTAWAALHITIHAALTTSPDQLAELCAGMLERDDGVWHLHDATGELMTIESSRERARVVRRGHGAGLRECTEQAGWLARLPDPPDVEAYLGGWER